jgi:hypothetical protein
MPLIDPNEYSIDWNNSWCQGQGGVQLHLIKDCPKDATCSVWASMHREEAVVENLDVKNAEAKWGLLVDLIGTRGLIHDYTQDPQEDLDWFLARLKDAITELETNNPYTNDVH